MAVTLRDGLFVCGTIFQMDLPERLTASLAALELLDGSVVVAVSGGPDSVALLDLLDRTRAMHRLEIIVAHADHGIHPESAAVAATVEALAASLGYPCEVGRLRLGAGASETAAREARYRWPRRSQSGTLPWRSSRHITPMTRGNRADAAPVRFRPRGPGRHGASRGPLVRPLLPFRRSELAGYLEGRGSRPGMIRANAVRRACAPGSTVACGNRPPRAPG